MYNRAAFLSGASGGRTFRSGYGRLLAGREYSADSWKREKGELVKRTISFITGQGFVNHNSRKFHAKNTDPKRSHWNVECCNQDIQEIYHELFDEALERYNVKQTRKDRKSL